MYAESHWCSNTYKDIEQFYYNCTGYKSKEILSTHKADKNGSWLKQFNSYEEYYRVTLLTFKNYYWDVGLDTPSKISSKWVGHRSEGWISAVTKIKNEL